MQASRINQVGIPTRIAETLTIPIYVTPWNIEHAKKYLESTEYPTVLNVITKEGIRKRLTDTNREEMLKTVAPGYIIERQLVDGDIGLMNRQPTLHRLSIMAHKVKVLPGRTMSIHVSTCFPYNADFDGDEMNFHLPQSLEAQAEARYLMQPKDLILSPRDGKPIMSIEEDEIIGMFFLTRDGAVFAKDEACLLLASAGIHELPKADKKGMYSGKAIFSMMLPKDLDFEAKRGTQTLTIKKGEITDGMVSESFVGESNGSLILKIFEDYGPDFTTEFLLRMAKISVRVTALMGTTISVKDYYNSDAINKELGKIISDVGTKASELVQKLQGQEARFAARIHKEGDARDGGHGRARGSKDHGERRYSTRTSARTTARCSWQW